MKEKIKQKSFIQIPILIGIIVAFVIASVGTGVVLYKWNKAKQLTTSTSKPLNQNQEQQTNQGGLSQQQELEQARLEAEKAEQEVEKLKAEEAQKNSTPQPEKTVQESLAPVVTGVTPQEILTNLDNYLIISGKNFKKAEVWIGGKNFGVGTSSTDKAINIKILSGILKPNIYDVQVRNSDGKSSVLNDSLTVVGPPLSTTTKNTTQEIANKVSPAVVQIKNDRCAPNDYCAGTGMIIDSSGYILTNAHVIRDDDIVEIKLNSGTIVNGNVIGWNQIYDLAIVKISNSSDYVILGDSDKVILGEDSIALGFPLSTFPSSVTVLEGIISSKGKTDSSGIVYLQTSANIQHGSSGGPLLNRNAEVIGINTFCESPIESYCILTGYAYAISINSAKSILSDLKAGAKVLIPESTPQPPTPTPSPSPTPSDTQPPQISNIQVANIGITSATINWTTNELAISQIGYGTTQSLGNFTSIDYNLSLSHSFVFSSLSGGTTYYYKIISKDTSGNQSVSSISSFSTQAVPITPGTLTVALSSGSPSSGIITAPSTDVAMAKFAFSALHEAFTVDTIQITANRAISNSATEITADNYLNVYLRYKDASGTEVTSDPIVFSGDNATFTNLAIYVLSGKTAEVGVYANIVASDYANNGDGPQLSLAYYKASSGSQPSVIAFPNISANQMLLYKTAPMAAIKGLTTGTLPNGTNQLYGVTITAANKGDVGLKKITFNVSPGMSSTSDTIGTFKFYRGTTDITNYVAITKGGGGDLIGGTLGSSATTVVVTFATEEVIGADTSQTYYLKAVVTGVDTVGENIQTYIKADTSWATHATYSAQAASNNFVWSDRFYPSINHNENTADWDNGYLVSTLPTDCFTLSR